MSHFGKNIKKIRTVKKLSQTAFAEIFNIKRASIGAYEEGRAEAKIDTVIEIANYFNLTLDQLLKKELKVNELFRFDIFKHQVNSETGKITLERSVNHSNIPYVSAYEYGEFIKSVSKTDYMEHLPRFTFREAKSQLIAVEHRGNSMQYLSSGIKHGDILFCKRLVGAEKAHVLDGSVCVVVTDKFMETYRVYCQGQELRLDSDNPDFDTKVVSLDEVRALLEVKSLQTSFLKKPSQIEDRIFELERKIEGIVTDK